MSTSPKVARGLIDALGKEGYIPPMIMGNDSQYAALLEFAAVKITELECAEAEAIDSYEAFLKSAVETENLGEQFPNQDLDGVPGRHYAGGDLHIMKLASSHGPCWNLQLANEEYESYGIDPHEDLTMRLYLYGKDEGCFDE